MRILVLGASGMLGHKLILKFMDRHEILGTLRRPNENLSVLLKGRESMLQTGIDVFDQEKIRDLVKSFKPDAVINCIGIVKQLKEAYDPYISISVNALFPHQMERLANEFGFRLVHLSTDCVFSGKQGPYSEENASDVSDLYGQTKYLGEVKGANALTLRTSIIGREISPPYTGLVEWYLSQNGKDVNGYTGALYTGLTTNAMADAIEHVLVKHKQLSGLYQLSADSISKFDLLKIVKDVYAQSGDIKPHNDFHCDRRLDSTRFRSTTGWTPLSWKDMIMSMHAEDERYYAGFKKAA